MSFAILRHAKIKSTTKGAAVSHNHRLSDEAKINIDKAKSHLNVYFAGPGAKDRIDAKVPQKHRKDAVIAVEILLTSGPEFFDEIEADREKLMVSPKFKAWVNGSIEWAKKEFGANLVDAVLHMDESTPHIHILAVPLTLDGRLCAKEITSRPEMQRRQSDYAQVMSRFGLERGLPAIETKRRHIGLKEAAGSGGKAAQQAKAQADLLAKAQGELESSQAELVKVTEQAQSALAMAKARAKEEMQGASEEIKTAKSRNEYLQMRNEKIRLALIDSTEEVKKLDKHTKELQAELVATNEKLALALEEKATAIRALVQSGEKSPTILKTADGHDEAAAQVRRLAVMNVQAEATKAAQEVQEAFQVKWAGAKVASPAERALNVVDVCGRQAVYALGRGNFAIHTFEPGEVVPKLNLSEQQKNGIQR